MAWDDQDKKNDNGKGPWGSRDPGQQPNRPKNPWDQPRPNQPDDAPDLDAVLRQAQDKFGRFFGGKPSRDEGKKGSDSYYCWSSLYGWGLGFT